MFTMQTREWLEGVTVPVGGEARWDGGRLRLWLEKVEVELERGLLARWFGKKDGPAVCRISVQLETPERPRFDHGMTMGFPAGFPRELGPFFQEDGPLLATRRGAVFEITAIEPREQRATVRAGYAEAPAGVDVHGELEALEGEARRFVRAWMELPVARRWAGRNERVRGLPAIAGYGLTLMPMSTGSLAVTFHRDGHRYFVRTYGGCLAPVEAWYGPYVARGETYELEG